MKKLILALVLVLAFAFPVLASEEEGSDLSGTVTVGVDYLSTGELIDTAEFTIETDISDDLAVSVTLDVEEVLFGTADVVINGTLKYTIDEGETAEIGAELDVVTSDVEVYGQYLGLPITDDMLLNGKVLGNFPANTYYAVGTLIYDVDEDIQVIVEARLDSDGGEVFSAEAQVLYPLTDSIDLKVGAELNSWSDDINDWDDCEIVDGTDCVYVEVVFRF